MNACLGGKQLESMPLAPEKNQIKKQNTKRKAIKVN